MKGPISKPGAEASPQRPHPGDHRREVARFFDRGARSWRVRYDATSFDAYNYQERGRIALEWLARERRTRGAEPRLLEIGCGAGVQASEAARQGWRVAAGDFSIGILEEAASRTTEPDWLVFDAERLPFRAGSLDAVMLLGVIGYLRDPRAALRRVRELMKPDGVLVVSWYADGPYLLDRLGDAISFVPDRAYLSVKRRLFGHRPADDGDGGFYRAHNQPFPPPEFLELLGETGFDVREHRAVNFGALRFMGKALWSDGGDIRASRLVERVHRMTRLPALGRAARTHLALAVPAQPGRGDADHHEGAAGPGRRPL